jgi:hypothetical protein
VPLLGGDGSGGAIAEEAVMLQGGCYCGRVRYQASGTPFHETSCHCSMCRRTAGAPFVAWFSVRRSEFRLLAGEPARFRSSSHATRSFCANCGTQLTFEDDHWPDEIDVTIASLDDPQAVAPRDQTWVSSKLAWVGLDDSLPAFPQARSEQ